MAISRRRQIYAMIGVELRTHGEFSSYREDGSVKMHLHTYPIVVKISTVFSTNATNALDFTLYKMKV